MALPKIIAKKEKFADILKTVYMMLVKIFCNTNIIKSFLLSDWNLKKKKEKKLG